MLKNKRYKIVLSLSRETASYATQNILSFKHKMCKFNTFSTLLSYDDFLIRET